MTELKKLCIYIISGGSGASGEQVVRTALAQFSTAKFDVITVPHVRIKNQVSDLISAASGKASIVVLTLVDEELNTFAINQAKEHKVFFIDLMRPLLRKASEITGEVPLGHPGLYRKLHKAYFDRVAAMEYTVAHDDGKDPGGWKDCEIMIIGVSRVGKTPLSLYLSVLGWKVANVPLIPNLEISPALFKIDRKRIIGLTMRASQLLIHRQHRQRRLGVHGPSPYSDPLAIQEEISFFNSLIKRHGITTIDVTYKPIETSADEIMKIIIERFEDQERKQYS
ncbi:MAG: kinase/pyrophosphorylase [Anaerolineaceae bacterium]|nr:kinase/pyrophosphorylase [Anaerolineaceae bacterium]